MRDAGFLAKELLANLDDVLLDMLVQQVQQVRRLVRLLHDAVDEDGVTFPARQGCLHRLAKWVKILRGVRGRFELSCRLRHRASGFSTVEGLGGFDFRMPRNPILILGNNLFHQRHQVPLRDGVETGFDIGFGKVQGTMRMPQPGGKCLELRIHVANGEEGRTDQRRPLPPFKIKDIEDRRHHRIDTSS